MAAPSNGDRLASALSASASASTAAPAPGASTASAPAAGRRLSPRPRPFPLLMLPEPAAAMACHPPDTCRGFYHILTRQLHTFSVLAEASHRCVASAHGWIIFAAVDAPRSLVLQNPIMQRRIDVQWPFGEDYIDRLHATLTSSPLDPECRLVIASDEIIAYCRPCPWGQWDGWHMLQALGFRYDAAASDIISVGAVVYLVDDRRLFWRANVADPDPDAERRWTCFPPPYAGRMRHYVVEAAGVVFLVISNELHSRVALYWMDWGGGRWTRAEPQPSDCILLLGRGCSAAVPRPAQVVEGTVLFARQPSTSTAAAAGGGGGESVTFWVESMLSAQGSGPVRPLTGVWATLRQQPSEFRFRDGDSFWFFPTIHL